MHRPSNAARLSPRAARLCVDDCPRESVALRAEGHALCDRWRWLAGRRRPLRGSLRDQPNSPELARLLLVLADFQLRHRYGRKRIPARAGSSHLRPLPHGRRRAAAAAQRRGAGHGLRRPRASHYGDDRRGGPAVRHRRPRVPARRGAASAPSRCGSPDRHLLPVPGEVRDRAFQPGLAAARVCRGGAWRRSGRLADALHDPAGRTFVIDGDPSRRHSESSCG